MTEHSTSQGKPSVSLIILMRNEERFVERCLESLIPQIDRFADSEILCVDGMSTDRTREIIEDYTRRCSQVRLIDNPEKIVSSGFNRGVRDSRGDLIFCLSCHARYAEDFVTRCLEVSQRTEAEGVGGYLETLPGRENAVGRSISAATSSRFGVGGSSFRTGGDEREVDTVPFGCYRREVFERFGYFDERLVRNQDIEFNSRIRAGGGKLVISPKIKLTYFNRATFAGIRQQAFNNGLWNPYTIYLVGGGLRPRHFVPMAFVLSLIVLGVAGFFFWPIWLVLAGEVALYLLAAGVAAFQVSRKKHVSGFLVWLTFLQLHVWYGLGSLWGVLTVLPKFGFRKERKPGKALADRKD